VPLRTETFRRRTAIVEALRGLSRARDRERRKHRDHLPPLLKKAHVGSIYLLIGLAILRFFEYEGRRTASLETF